MVELGYYSFIPIKIDNHQDEEFLLRSKLIEDKLTGIKRIQLLLSNVENNYDGTYEPENDKDLSDSIDAFKFGNSVDGKRCVTYAFLMDKDGDENKLIWKLVKLQNGEESSRKTIDSLSLNRVHSPKESLLNLLKELSMILKEKDEMIDRLVKSKEDSTPVTGSSAMDKINQWTRQVRAMDRRKYPIRNLGSESLESANVQQKNLKQKFIRLLKKFKVPETEAFESEEQYKALEQVIAQNDNEIEEFLDDEDDIGDFSDSGQEFDDISISSTPKPSLKPYFSTWTLEGPRDSASINASIGAQGGGSGATAAPTTSNNLHNNSITSPLLSTHSSHTTPGDRIGGGTGKGGDGIGGGFTGENANPNSSSVSTPPDSSERSLKQQTSEEAEEKSNDKKSSKFRRILRKKDSTTKNTQVKSKK